MSHYITAENEDTKYELAVGISSSSIDSICDTGFDIYNSYGLSWGLGFSGPGVTITVDHKTAKQAYFYALAWAKSLEIKFPDKYEAVVIGSIKYNKDFRKLLDYEKFNTEEIENEAASNISFYDFLTEKDIDNSFYFFSCIIEFTYNVYAYTKMGKTMELFFG